jgi:hypothetical protein
MEKFVTYLAKGKTMFVEFHLDKYVNDVQPKTMEEVQGTFEVLLKDVLKVNEVTIKNNMKQCIVIDLCRGLQYEKFNFATTGALCHLLVEAIPNHPALDAIELRNVHHMAKALWEVSKVFIPKELRGLIYVYTT